jgi:hypothetical protein
MTNDQVDICPVCERSLTPKMIKRPEGAMGGYSGAFDTPIDAQAMTCPTCKSELHRGSPPDPWQAVS